MTVIGCEFRANRALGGGALYTWWGNPMSIVNCEFVGNEAYGSGVYQEGGGAIHNDACRIELVNTVIRNNTSASPGGALKAKWRPQAKLTNCTVVGNESEAENGGAIHVFNGAFVEVANSILWDNGTQPISLGDAGGGRGVNTQFSCIQGGWEGEGIIEKDPLLLSADFGCLRLRSDSPCIDAGSDEQLNEDLVDLDGDGKFFEPTPNDAAKLSRFVGQVDLGAYERQKTDEELERDSYIEHAKFLHVANGLGAIPARDESLTIPTLADRLAQWGGLITSKFAIVQTAPIEDAVNLTLQLKELGYRPLRFRPYTHGGILASAIWVRDYRDSHLTTGMTRDEVLELHRVYSDQTLSPVDIAGYVISGENRYSAVWVDLADTWRRKAEISLEMAPDNRPIRFAAHRDQRMPYTWQLFRAADRQLGSNIVWYPADGPSAARAFGKRSYEHTDFAKQCQTDVSLSQRSFAQTYDYLSINGCWSVSPEIESTEVHDLAVNEHVAAAKGLERQGYSPASISVTWDSTTNRLVAASVWQRLALPATGPRLQPRQERRRFDYASDFLAGLKLQEPVLKGDLHFVKSALFITYKIENIADRDFHIVFDEGSRVTHFLGIRQLHVQRVADENGAPVDEPRKPAGGNSIPIDPLVRKGSSVLITDSLNVADLLPGTYRAYVHLSATSDSIQQEASTEFTVLPLPQAVISTRLGDMTVELFPTSAPKAVENFLTHAKNGFYDETVFHAVAPDMAIQGGDPTGTGNGGASIWGKPFASEIDDSLSLDYGFIAMGSKKRNEHTSQFFIITDKSGRPGWEGTYPIFGRVVEGYDTLDKIGSVESKNRVPIDPVSMKITLKESAISFLERIQEKRGSLPQVTINTKLGTMLLTLFPDSAPNTVREFLTRVRDGVYNETTFDEAMAGSLVSGGDTKETPGDRGDREGEQPEQFELDEELALNFGMVAMSRGEGRSPGSRFFIIANKAGEHGKQSDFAIFGQIHRGFGVLEKLAQMEAVDGRVVEPIPMTIELRESALRFLQQLDEQE